MNQSREYFDRRSEEWSQLYLTDKRFARRKEVLTALLRDATKPDGYSPVMTEQPVAIDIGCGTGVFTRVLQHLGYRCIGLDLSPKMIEYAKSFSDPSIEYFTADLSNAPSLPEAELVIALSVLEYLPSIGQTLDLVAELLGHGGIFVASVPNLGAFRFLERIGRKLFSKTALSQRGEYLGLQKSLLTPEDLDSAMTRRGFQKTSHIYFNAGFVLPKISNLLEKQSWWAAMYAAAYKKTTA